IVSLLSLILGLFCILLVSRRFASPITALAKRVEDMEPQAGFELDRLGITEIDQLVDSIETLNRNVSKDIARTEFFSRMSHDMRTPMNAIISFSSPELLENADETVKNNYLEKIHFSGEYLLGLINEVLDMTKIESKKTELHLSPTLISHTWETVISIIEKLAQKKNLHFTKDIADYPGLFLLADEQHLNQILVNLLSNAVKFTPDNGEIELHISIDDKRDDPEYADCNIIIRDTGIGISQNFMKDLYTPFEQENDSREGTGLGLSIAKKLVELMGGVIECESAKGMGTTFFIYLSMKKCAAPSAVSPAVPEKVPTVSLEGKQILVCEDHPMNTQIICRLLERKGIQVTATENGLKCVEAFAHAPENTFHGILMDIRMPVMDGLTAAGRIRSLNRKDAASIPIIAMTANAFAEDVRASHKAGMNAHLSKPIEPDKLYSTLESLIKE
ncbi:MAG: ATP-binding protein, partial [Lachnospiraceae bacterium]|nr:ATP-binding protein [Lachnospiraceae bacterium]